MQVLGNIIKDPTLLSETEKYQIESQDFPEKFHSSIFATVYNLFHDGTEKIDEYEIDGYLKEYPIKHNIFTQNNGLEYIRKIIEMAKKENFDYHYSRVKKFSLVREMSGIGFNMKDIYDDSIFDPVESEKMQKRFDGLTIKDIINVYDNKMIGIKDDFESDTDAISAHAGKNIMELIRSLEDDPDVGLPLNSPMLSDIARGSRLKKFYLRSSTSGGGKTRSMVADGCKLSAVAIYDINNKTWVENEFKESSVIISTEMMIEELQQMTLAYISGVEEHKIVTNTMSPKEKERVYAAGEVIMNSNIYFEELPNFDTNDIERVIEKNIIKHDTRYVWFDYLHTSMSIMSELASGMTMREDQILLLMATRLKEIANKHDVYLMSATQLSADWEESWRKGEEINQNHLQNSKSVVNKADLAAIMLEPSKKELDEIQPILANLDMGNGKGFGNLLPNQVTHVFKNRGNPHNKVKVFSNINLGNMRVRDMFVTDYENNPITVDRLIVKSK